MNYDKANDMVDKLLKSLLSWYENNLETSTRRSDFIFDLVQLLYCKCHKVNLRKDGLYIDSPDWMKKKKATINLKNRVDKCFQYAVIVALNDGEIELHPGRVPIIRPFINKYKWKGLSYPSKNRWLENIWEK